MKTAILLGGQGAAMPTLGLDLYEHEAAYRAVIDRASAILGYDLYATVLKDETKLRDTAYAQPAIFAHEMGIYAVISEYVPEPVALLGLSLGEYTALTLGGVFEFADAVRLLQKRGRYMQIASEEQETTMVAVLGKEQDVILAAIKKMQADDVAVYLANHNTRKQIVVGGTLSSLQVFTEYVMTQTKVRCIPLTVAGAFHTPFMGNAALALRDELHSVTQGQRIIPVYSNTTTQPFGQDVATTLTTQMTTPTFFADAFTQMMADTLPERVIEIGADGTLLKFAQQMNTEIQGMSVFDLASVQAFKEQAHANS